MIYISNTPKEQQEMLKVCGLSSLEPTETESKETLDAFIAAMKDIAEKAVNNPDELHKAPVATQVSRLDETRAVKSMNLVYI